MTMQIQQTLVNKLDTYARAIKNGILRNSSLNNDDLKLNSCVEIALLIQNMRIVYSLVLSNKPSPEMRAQWREIEILLKELDGSPIGLIAIEQRTQALLRSLPFSSGHPQVTRIWACPQVKILSTGMHAVRIKCEGDFTYAQDPRFQPTMVIGDHRSLPIEPTQRLLQFHHELKLMLDKPFCLPVTLEIPTILGWNCWSSMMRYELWVKIPPMIIGELETHCIVDEGAKNEVKKCETSIFTMRGNPEDPYRWSEVNYQITPEPGWIMISAHLLVHNGTMGSHKIIFTRLNKDAFEFKVGAVAEKINTVCLVHFSVKYIVRRGKVTPEKTVVTSKEVIHWGDTKQIALNFAYPRIAKFVLNALDGLQYIFFPGISEQGPGFFTEGQAANPYLRIKIDDKHKVLHIDTSRQ